MSYYGNGIGEVTAPRVAMSTLIIGGAVIAFAAGGVVSAFSDEFFLDGKSGRDYKKVAKRNAALGGALGAVAAAGMLTA